MKQCITTLVFAITLFLPLLAQEKPLAEHQEFTSNTHLLESWIKAQMDYRGLPGMSLGIVYDQELVYARGFGYSDLEQKT
ncbi:MAG: serine hydrolase, partial [Calditrichaeota bacterium]|nr:serine hydrolase [Calditrichota bacterium]